MTDFLLDFLTPLNETLASAIVIIASSLLLYNLSRNLRNRVARTSAVMLACVTTAYATDVLLSLEPGRASAEDLLRTQWVGLAFMPAAMFHVSDALLATTGLPSRGRRKRAVRLLYGVAAIFMLLATFTDTLILPEIVRGRVSLGPAPFFWVYTGYFILINLAAFMNVDRARRRCLTRGTRRRMTYLQAAMLMPWIGIYPYSVLLPPGEEFSLGALILVNLANMLVFMMLLVLAYPLSFFGSRIPDRVVKSELLKFMLLGPGTGVLALAVILFTKPAANLVGLPGEDFMPFGVVAVILLWQWMVDLILPWIQRFLIYNEEDDEQLSRIQNLSEHLLTRTDLLQLLEATLESACDYLRVGQAFVAQITDGKPEMVRSIGKESVTNQVLQEDTLLLLDQFQAGEEDTIHLWDRYWMLPLLSRRNTDVTGEPSLIGTLAIESKGKIEELTPDEFEMLRVFAHRTARTLDDMRLQTEIYAALAGLLPQITITRPHAAEVEYLSSRSGRLQPTAILERDQIIEQIHAALRHYWGGPGLSSSRLTELIVVRNRLGLHEGSSSRALRSVLQDAIDKLRPQGERDMRSAEWVLYNIIDLRFIESKKVKETARRLFLSEANLYRKQNIAIEALADTLIAMELEAQTAQKRLVET